MRCAPTFGAMPSLRRTQPTVARWSHSYASLSVSSASLATSASATSAWRAPQSGSSSTGENLALDSKTSMPEYFNFATRDVFMAKAFPASAHGRRPRPRTNGLPEMEQQMRFQARQRSAADTDDEPVIYRKDMALPGWSRKQSSLPQISVDVTTKRFFDMFCDYETKRCKLCNESFVQWHVHSTGIPHNGREGVLLELLRPFCGTPEEQLRRWTRRLVNSTEFGRIPALSHLDSHVRKSRLKYILRYLKDRGVLHDVFNVTSGLDGNAGRTFEFERLEFIGDGVAKYVLNNVMNLVFPVSEGGCRGRLANLQFVMDGNEGLARGYDFLELQDLTLSARVVSKFKSDVVETLLGELQFYVWSTQVDLGVSPLTFPFTRDIYSLRALAQHAMYEVAITLFLYHVEYIGGMLQRVAREEQLQYVRADPSLLSMQSQGSDARRGGYGRDDGGDVDDDDYNPSGRRGAASTLHIAAPTVKLMKTRVARAHLHGGSAATFLESTNYDNFKRVVPIGGLLPRPFARGQLAVIPNYMPHLQRDSAMTLRMSGGTARWAAQLDKELVGGDSAETAYRLGATPTKRESLAPERLSVPRLKDEELIAELI